MEEQITLLEQAVAELQQKVAQFDAVAFAAEVRFELVLWQEKTEGLIRNLELQLLDTIRRIDGLDALLKKADELLKKLESALDGLDPEKIKQAVLAELAGWRAQTDGRLTAVEDRVTKLEDEIKKLSPEKIVEKVLESIQAWRDKVDADLLALQKSLDKLAAECADCKADLDAAIADLKKEIVKLQDTDKTHDDHFLKLDEDLAKLALRIEAVAKEKIDPALIQAEVEKLINAWKTTVENRLTELEKLNAIIAGLKKQIDELPKIFSAEEIKQLITAELTVLENKLAGEIGDLKTEIENLKARVLVLERKITPDINQIVILVIKELEVWQNQIEERVSTLEGYRRLDRQDIDTLIQGLSDLAAKVDALIILTQTDVTNLIEVALAPWIVKIEALEQLISTLETNSTTQGEDIEALKIALEALKLILEGPLPANWEAQVKQIIEALLSTIKADVIQLKLDKTTLEAALALLTTTVSGLQTDLAALAETVANLPVPLTEAEINALIGIQIDVLQTDLEAQIAALELRISALETAQANILVLIEGINVTISAHTTKIELLNQLIIEVKTTVQNLPHIPSTAEIIAIVNNTISSWKLEIETNIQLLQDCCEEGKGKITVIEQEIEDIKNILKQSDASAVGIRLARRCLTGWGIVGGLEIKSDETCSIHLSKGSGITPRGVLTHACDALYFTHYRKFEKPTNDPVFKNYELWELLVWETLDIAPGDPIPDDIHPLTPQTGEGSETPLIADKAIILLPGEQQNYYLLIRIEDLVALSGKTAELQYCMGNTGFDPDMVFSESFSPHDALPTDNDLYMAFNPVMLLPEIPLFRFGFRPPDECDPEELDDPNFPMICSLDHLYDTWLPIIQDAFRQVDQWVKKVMEQYHELLFPQLAKDVFEGKLELLFEKWTAFTHYNKHALPNKARKFYVQYFYDWARDLIAAYHELRSELQILMAELCLCRPDLLLEQRPWLMLGVAVQPDQDGLAAPLRDAFHQSPIFNGNFIRLETCRLYYRRQFEMIEGFYLPGYQDDLTLPCWCHHEDDGWEPDFSRLRITPGKGYIHALSRQSLPFYYPLAPNMESLHFYWEYRRAKMRQLDYHLSYHASDADDSYSHRPEVIRPLYYSLDPYDFYRVEGHISRSFIALNQKVDASPAEALQFMVKRYNLDFEVVEVDIYCNQCRFLSQKYPYPNLSPAEFFNSFRQDIMGAEHLAGVPKGGTFIVVTTKMVLDDVSQTVAIADFALPYRCCPQKPMLCRFDLAVKMAGNCVAGKRELYITVVPSNLTTGRFLMTIDDSPLEGTVNGTTTKDGMFDYQNGQAITITTPVAADNQKHKIKVKDPSLDCCGEIIVLVPDCACKINLQANVATVCIEGYREIDVVISAINQGTKGFNLKVDGSIYEENATYEPDGITTKTVAIAGDGEDHEIKVTDVENPNCEATLSVRVPDCRHIISVSAVPSDVCLQDNMTSVEVIITTKNPPPFGEFNLKYDGSPIDEPAPSHRRARSKAAAAASAGNSINHIAAGPKIYEPSGSNVLSINVTGDGKKHLLEVIDANDPSIHAFTEFLVKDCQDIIVN